MIGEPGSDLIAAHMELVGAGRTEERDIPSGAAGDVSTDDLEPILVGEPARRNDRALGALGRLDQFEPALDPLKPAIDVVEAHRQARVIGMEPGDLTLEPT